MKLDSKNNKENKWFGKYFFFHSHHIKAIFFIEKKICLFNKIIDNNNKNSLKNNKDVTNNSKNSMKKNSNGFTTSITANADLSPLIPPHPTNMRPIPLLISCSPNPY